MIILDYSAVAIANMMIAIKKDGEKLTKFFAMHMILNSIRRANKKFRKDFGSMVISCDNKTNWRRLDFELYKWKRRQNKKNSDIDWDLIYECLDYVKEEIDTDFPYLVIEEHNAEADDIIGALAWYATVHSEPTVIVSNDKDFIQCHSDSVCQWKPIEQAFVRHPYPGTFLKELIIRGDTEDGVPNIKSQNDIFTIKGKRQKSIFQKDLDIWLKDDYNEFLVELDKKFDDLYNKELKKDKKAVKVIPSVNYDRNDRLINLHNTPEYIVNNAIEKFKNHDQHVSRPKMTQFFIKHQLRYLHEKMSDFI